MTALDEFTLEAEAASEAAPPSAVRRTHRGRLVDRPGVWASLAGAAILAGILAAPTAAPKPAAAVPTWSGLGSIILMSAEPGAELLALARDAAAQVEAIDGDGNPIGSLVWAITEPPEWLSTAEALETALAQIDRPEPHDLHAMEALAPGSDWLCEELASGTAECTALDGSATYAIGGAGP